MEEQPGFFGQCKEFRVKNYFIPAMEDIEINSFYSKPKPFQQRKSGSQKSDDQQEQSYMH